MNLNVYVEESYLMTCNIDNKYKPMAYLRIFDGGGQLKNVKILKFVTNL